MVNNIWLSNQEICVMTNGGQQTSTHIADFKNLGEVWFNPNSIANILSLSHVQKVCKVTMDTSVEAALIVHRLDGGQMKFVEHHDGLYFFDTHLKVSDDNYSSTSAYNLLMTVATTKNRLSNAKLSLQTWPETSIGN
jgi:hypothetical protein